MEFKFQKFQAAKLLLLILSLTLIPFISTSLRSSYLYFLLNIFIVVLGYEAGILHLLMEPAMEMKPVVTAAAPATLPENRGNNYNSVMQAREGSHGKPAMTMTEGMPSTNDKAVLVAKVHKVKRTPSLPSIFFIGSSDGEDEMAEEAINDEEEDVFEAVREISAQELFARAESFIGNFYRQLKIQREESWKKIHGFYHKPF